MATITSTEAGATGRYINLGASPANNVDVGAQTWIVYCNPSGSGGGGFAYHIGKTTAGSTAGLRFFIDHNGGSPRIAFGVDSAGAGGSPQRAGTGGEVSYGSWQHHTVTWDGSLTAANIHTYVGSTESTYLTTTDGTTSINSDSAKKLFLLNRGDTGNLGREFVGDNGYIARWSRVLNSTERANVIANGPLSEPTGLILCWANDQDYSTNAITAAGRSTRVTGGTPTNTALGGDVTVSTTVGNAVAAGVTATVSSVVTIAATPGNATAAGVTATITTASDTTITATPGNAVAAGVTANIANISLEGAYERASVILASSTVVGAGDSAIISIAPKLQESEVTDTRWLEPSVDVVGVNGYRPTFRFLNYKDGSGGTHGYSVSSWTTSRRMMYSYDDGVTWNYFDTAPTLNTGSQWVEFRHSTAFTGNRVRIARGRQLTVHQVGDWLASMATTYSSFFGPSASAVSYTPTGSVSGFAAQSFIADEYSTQTDSLSNTVPVMPFYAAEINDTGLSPVGGHSKRLAVVTAGVHAAEDHAEYVMRQFIEYLCGSSTEAQALRRNYRILLYPMINAPGKAGGGWRGSWTQGTSGADDANRHFSDTGSTLEIVDKPKAVITTDRASTVPDWAIDFHGSWHSDHSIYYDSGDVYQDSFKTKLATFGGVTVDVEGASNTGFVSWYFHGLGAKLSVTHESGDGSPKSDAALATHGAAIVETLNSMMEDGVFFINAIPGDATAAGITATITTTGNTTISATPGNAVADGVTAGVTQTIASTVGNAVADGSQAQLNRIFGAEVGNAIAAGVTASIGAASATIGRPTSDASNTGWLPSTGSDLYAMIDEVTPDDADYIYSTAVGQICEMPLSTTTYPGTASQTLKFRGSSSTGNSVIVRLKNTGGATVRTVTQLLTATDTEYDITLTSGEIAAITSGALSVELESA